MMDKINFHHINDKLGGDGWISWNMDVKWTFMDEFYSRMMYWFTWKKWIKKKINVLISVLQSMWVFMDVIVDTCV